MAGGLALGLTAGAAELTPYRSGLRRVSARITVALIVVVVVGLLYSLPTVTAYGLTVRFPFPDWGNAVLYFTSLMRVAFTGFVALPISLALGLVLAVLGMLLSGELEIS